MFGLAWTFNFFLKKIVFSGLVQAFFYSYVILISIPLIVNLLSGLCHYNLVEPLSSLFLDPECASVKHLIIFEMCCFNLQVA